MHLSSIEKMNHFSKSLDSSQSLKILDFGSKDINGSYKDIFKNERWEYTGIDTTPGKNVDFVLSDLYNWPFKDESYDVIISGQKLENVEWFWEIMREISRVLKPGGLACIIVPSSGSEHRNPVDTFRFYPDGLRSMSNWAGLEVLDCYTQWSPEGYKDSSAVWKDSYLVAKKPSYIDSKLISIMPLVSRDMYRSIRIVNSALQQQPTNIYKFIVHPIINSKDNSFVDSFSAWCRKNGVNHSITESNGTPSRGKNSAIKEFKKSNSAGMMLVDGDDIIYPTAARQLEFHLRQFPNLDFLVARAVDMIHSESGKIDFGSGVYGDFWSFSNFNPNKSAGPGKHKIFTDGQSASANMGSHIFYSRKLLDLVNYDEEQLLGEDFLFEFLALKEYVKGNIFFMSTTVSDFYLLDRTSTNNHIQKIHNKEQGTIYFNKILAKMKEVGEDRTCFSEVPVRYPELIFQYQDKVDFVRNVLSQKYE